MLPHLSEEYNDKYDRFSVTGKSLMNRDSNKSIGNEDMVDIYDQQ